jgi:hypothetical protein
MKEINMGPQRELITNEGSDAFYEGTLRYKNPYTDLKAIEWWFLGYDAAEEKHSLFADNQRLVLENDKLTSENVSLKKEVVDLSLEQAIELNGLEKTIRDKSSALAHHEVQETLLFSQRSDRIESIEKIVSWIESKKTLLFISREKLIADLKKTIK